MKVLQDLGPMAQYQMIYQSLVNLFDALENAEYLANDNNVNSKKGGYIKHRYYKLVKK